jgi:dTDP-4-amino-4,6-dideoxygalactose transaminase
VIKAGCRPIFIDIERDTFCISARDLSKKIDHVDAIVVVHMFGNLCDMESLLKVAAGKPIIEDCAQSLGSQMQGRMSGTMGCIGVYSFRSGKYLSAGEGGALYTNDLQIWSHLKELVNSLPKPAKTEEVRHTIETYIRSKLRSKPLFGLVGAKVWLVYNKKASYYAKSPIIMSQIFSHDHSIIMKRLLGFSQNMIKQQSYAAYYMANLNAAGCMLCCEKPQTVLNRYAFPVVFPSVNHRDAIANALAQSNISTIKPYQDVPEIAATYYNYRGGCPVSEKLAKTSLLLPCHYGLKQNDIQFITKQFNNSWHELTAKEQKSSL